MKRILKIILPAVLVAAMLVTGMPGTALAQDDQTPERRGALVARVAEILNINQQELEDAFKQAQRELREEALEARLQELIASGTLTQQQADEFRAWIETRPDIPAVSPRQIKKLLDEGKITQEQADAYKAWLEAKPDIPRIRPALGEKLVKEGIITQQQADEYKAWLESRPDIPRVPPRELKKLLDEGKITQQQLDAFKAWVEARPDMPKIRPELRQKRVAKLQEHRDALAARVAEILGIDKQELENAFKQAQGELREKTLDTRLQELVNQGEWTQQQADAFKAWIKARPDVPPLRPARP